MCGSKASNQVPGINKASTARRSFSCGTCSQCQELLKINTWRHGQDGKESEHICASTEAKLWVHEREENTSKMHHSNLSTENQQYHCSSHLPLRRSRE